MRIKEDQIIEQLKENRSDLLFDMASDWATIDELRKMKLQLHLLNEAISSLESLILI